MTAPAPTADTIVDFIADIFARRGGEEYLGEPVTMAEHMLQAAHFADAAGEADVVVVAALLHDIGHFTSEFGTFSMADTASKAGRPCRRSSPAASACRPRNSPCVHAALGCCRR